MVKYCIHMETSTLLAKGCKTQVPSQLLLSLSRDDLYLVIPSVTSGLGFCGLILRYSPFSLPVRQLKCNSHCIWIRILTGTSTLVKETCFSQIVKTPQYIYHSFCTIMTIFCQKTFSSIWKVNLRIDWLIGSSFAPYQQYLSHVTAVNLSMCKCK